MKMIHFGVFLAALLMMALPSSAQTKQLYTPVEWQNFNANETLLYKKTDTANQYTWSETRSKQSDNCIVYWDKGYGSTAPNQLSTSSEYYVDIDDLLAKAEAFYQLECNTLGFVDPSTSNVSKYKIMILLNHTTDWICYGGGYDFQISALWLSPSTCHPVGSAVAHEVGHSFHYMCYAEDSNHGAVSSCQTGFHGAVGNGAAIWETTANWQALQSYPEEIFTESYTYDVFSKSHNYAFSHEWHRYQAYMFLFYLCQYYNDIQTVAKVWNYPETTVKDFNQVLMDLKGLSVSDLYRLHYEFACRDMGFGCLCQLSQRFVYWELQLFLRSVDRWQLPSGVCQRTASDGIQCHPPPSAGSRYADYHGTDGIDTGVRPRQRRPRPVSGW